ncbi:hypothetical protein SFA35_04515 [Pseudomonas sp. HR96]|uniref:hypothetical protein n=1 Tax=Pseudomonas sp. HR96 TaxID=1027966 RepID=UPI002A75E6F3|nr:hypothetical protein [Pseudomonas sp. HR96]WPP00644.1 hypothetical protein SFA35_04515 [Pseudomonas sp. HR96]
MPTYQRPFQLTPQILRQVAAIEPVTAVFDGKPVLGQPREVQEVRNAILAI